MSRDVDDVTSDVSLGEESKHDPADSPSSDDVTAAYPAEVIVEGQQMNKVGHLLWNYIILNLKYRKLVKL